MNGESKKTLFLFVSEGEPVGMFVCSPVKACEPEESTKLKSQTSSSFVRLTGKVDESNHILHLSKSTDTFVKTTDVQIKLL